MASSLTAVLVRGAGALTNLVAMPIALHVLGADRFAAFLVISGVVNWVSLGAFGVQSALGKRLAVGDVPRETAAELLGAALVYAFCGALAVASLIALASGAWALSGRHAPPSPDVVRATWLMTAMVVAQVVLQVFDGVQIGRLTAYVSNLFRILGSLFTFLALLLLPHVWRSLCAFVVAINGGLILSGLLNGWAVSRTTPPSFRHLGRGLGRIAELAGSGLAFILISLASLADTQGLVLVRASGGGAHSVMVIGLYVRLVVIYFSVITILTGPVWPALLNARRSHDRRWIDRTVRRTAVLVLGSGLAAGVVIALFGQRVLSAWTHQSLPGDAHLQLLIGFYFAQLTWSHFWAILLLGRRQEQTVAAVLVTESAAIFLLYLVFPKTDVGLAMAADFAVAICSNVALPVCYLLRRREPASPLIPHRPDQSLEPVGDGRGFAPLASPKA